MPAHQHETLITNPTATLLFDGVLFFCYDRERKITQAGVHVKAEGHSIFVTVETENREAAAGSANAEAPKPVEFGHYEIAARAPFYLFVTNDPSGTLPGSGSASLFKENNLRFSKSFGYVLDFQSEEFYPRDLKIKKGILAPINLLNGTFYSAELTNAKRRVARQPEANEPAGEATAHAAGVGHNASPEPVVEESIGRIASLIAADISDEGGYLVVKDKDLIDVFPPLPLSAATWHRIRIVNAPPPPATETAQPPADHHHPAGPGHHHPAGPGHHAGGNHFSEFYEAFDLKPGEKQFEVERDEISAQGVVDPPCLPPQGGRTSSLPDWP